MRMVCGCWERGKGRIFSVGTLWEGGGGYGSCYGGTCVLCMYMYMEFCVDVCVCVCVCLGGLNIRRW